MKRATDRLQEIIERPEGYPDLAEASLLLAREAYPKLEVERYLERLRRMADAVLLKLPRPAAVGDVVFALNEYLFMEEGFGRKAAERVPRYGFLNEVMEHRQGIPVTLSVLYIALGRALGLPFHGVDFPGRFLVKFRCNGGDVLIDPYAGGLALEALELELLLHTGFPLGRPAPVALMACADKRTVILAMLRELQRLFVRQGALGKALWAADRMVSLAPAEPSALRARGRLYERLHYLPGAIADYDRYLAFSPAADDGPLIRRRLARLRGAGQRLH